MKRFGFVHSMKQKSSLDMMLRATVVTVAEHGGDVRKKYGRADVHYASGVGGFRYDGVSVVYGPDSSGLADAILKSPDKLLLICVLGSIEAGGRADSAIKNMESTSRIVASKELLPGGAYEFTCDGSSFSLRELEKGKVVKPVQIKQPPAQVPAIKEPTAASTDT